MRKKVWSKERGGEARLPEVVGAIFVGDEEDGDCGVGVRGVDAVRGGGVVFAGVQGEGFLEGLAEELSVLCRVSQESVLEAGWLAWRAWANIHELRMSRLLHMAPDVGGFLSSRQSVPSLCP